MLFIDQWLRTNEPNDGVLVDRLLTYNRFSEVCAPDDFLTVSDSYSIIVILPPPIFLCRSWCQDRQRHGKLEFRFCYARVPAFPCGNTLECVFWARLPCRNAGMAGSPLVLWGSHHRFSDSVYNVLLHDMASALTIFPDMSILSITLGMALISLLFSRQASVVSVMLVLYEYADTTLGLRSLSSTVPRSNLPPTQIIFSPALWI